MQFSARNIALKKHGVRSEKKMRDIPSWLQANQHANLTPFTALDCRKIANKSGGVMTAKMCCIVI